MNIKSLTNSLLNFFFILVGLFLTLRFILKLFGANTNNGFVDWIYEMSAVLLEPFRGIFPVTVFENTYVLEFSTLFALLMYGLVAILIGALIAAIVPAQTSKKK